MDLAGLAALVSAHADALAAPVAPLRIGRRSYDTDGAPAIMATVNLSRDSTYRDSIAVTARSAVRRARIAVAAGAAVVDIGAESTTARAGRVDAADQIAQLVPVIEECAADGLPVSVETYSPAVTAACLTAGAVVLNMTGAQHQEQMFDLAAEHAATVVLCYSPGADVREVTDVELHTDPLPALLDHFAARLDVAARHGVTDVVVDPGMGFYYGNLTDPLVRVRHQARVIVNSFRLRPLGRPICQALPHAFDLFEEQFRSAEAFFAVLARLGGAGLLRTHEVPQVAAVATAMGQLDAGGGWGE
jgi:dihydropteroate synthase